MKTFCQRCMSLKFKVPEPITPFLFFKVNDVQEEQQPDVFIGKGQLK